MMTDQEWARSLTPEGCEWGIAKALETHDMESVAGFLRLLAVKDPHRASTVLDAFEMAKVLR